MQRTKNFRLLFILLFMLSPILSHALGLGDLQVTSGIGQPLKAEIKLTNLRGTPLSKITAQLASKETFNELGIQYPQESLHITFKTSVNDDGEPILAVNSTKPVEDPYLNFLVDVRWPNGRLVRKYTMLLNPPDLVEKIDKKTVSKVKSPSDGVVRHTYGPVHAKEDLWQIAKSVRTDRSIPIKQIVQAIFKANPHAFMHNSVDSLKVGAVLTIPTAQEIRSGNIKVHHTPSQQKTKSPQQSSVKIVKKQPMIQNTMPLNSGDLSQTDIQSSTLKIPTPKSRSYMAPIQANTSTTKQTQSTRHTMPNLSGTNEQQLKTLKQELAIAVEALNASKETNQALQEKLDKLQEENNLMTELVKQQQVEIKALGGNIKTQVRGAKKITTVKQVQAPQGMTISEPKSHWMSTLLLVLVAALLIVILWFVWYKFRPNIAKFSKLGRNKKGKTITPEGLVLPVDDDVSETSEADAKTTGETQPVDPDDIIVDDADELMDESQVFEEGDESSKNKGSSVTEEELPKVKEGEKGIDPYAKYRKPENQQELEEESGNKEDSYIAAPERTFKSPGEKSQEEPSSSILKPPDDDDDDYDPTGQNLAKQQDEVQKEEIKPADESNLDDELSFDSEEDTTDDLSTKKDDTSNNNTNESNLSELDISEIDLKDDETPKEKTASEKTDLDEGMLEFESGLYEKPEEKTKEEEPETKDESSIENDNGLDFTLEDDTNKQEELDTSMFETKLDLARAYIDMNKKEEAKEILEDILKTGTPEQQEEAKQLIESMS